jgi:AcrR family transcriptional regulator
MMQKTVTARGRPKDAQAAQAAILDAAEAEFAEHGFAGARVDAIAAASGYNKSLLFHYFDDKLGLYTAVIRRARREGGNLQALVFGPLSEDVATSPAAFRAFVEEAVQRAFDFYLAHPRLVRILAWEEAAGWTTLTRVVARLDRSHLDRFAAILERARRAGVLRPGLSADLALFLIGNVCRNYLSFRPVLQLMAGGEGAAGPSSLRRARAELAALIARGVVVDAAADAPAGTSSRAE